MSNLEAQVVEFVAHNLGVRVSKLRMDARLFHDLGVDGADGWELLEEFAERFHVDMTTLELDRHFGPEAGANPLTFVRWLFDPAFRRGDQMQPIRIKDLIQAATARRWEVLTVAWADS